MVGRCPVVEAKTGTVEVKALLDTGSEVSTVRESWFRQHFPELSLKDANWLTLRGAHGLETPSFGTVELEVDVLERKWSGLCC